MAHLGGHGVWPLGPVVGVVLPPPWHRGHRASQLAGIDGVEGGPEMLMQNRHVATRPAQVVARSPRQLSAFG